MHPRLRTALGRTSLRLAPLLLGPLLLACIPPEAPPPPPAAPPVPRTSDVLAAATAVINRGDDAFNRHDAPAMNALLDDDYVGSGVRVGSLTEGRAAAEAAIAAAYAHEADVEAFATRKSLTMHTDADGDAVWFVAVYDLEHRAEKGGPTAHEPLRETGVLRRRGTAYRFALIDSSTPRPGSEALPAPPTLPENTATELFDSFGRPHDGVRQGWGFSTILRHGGHTILFDGGDSADVLASNARALGVDLREVDIAVLSHDHMDHSAGIDYLLSVNPAVKLYVPAEPNLGDVGPVAVDPPSDKLPPLPTEQVYADGKKEVPRHSTG
ncbi:MAG TPA: MBL fold metallo-hydrolase, partial [Polyangiaceae bacterium]